MRAGGNAGVVRHILARVILCRKAAITARLAGLHGVGVVDIVIRFK